jgi:hypothetical protein
METEFQEFANSIADQDRHLSNSRLDTFLDYSSDSLHRIPRIESTAKDT